MRQKLADQDSFYAEKQNKVLNHLKSMEEAEFRRSMERLEVIENKQQKSKKIHDRIIWRRISEIREKNQISLSKLERYKNFQKNLLQKKQSEVLLKEHITMQKLEKIDKFKRKLALSMKNSSMTQTLKKEEIMNNNEHTINRK